MDQPLVNGKLDESLMYLYPAFKGLRNLSLIFKSISLPKKSGNELFAINSFKHFGSNSTNGELQIFKTNKISNPNFWSKKPTTVFIEPTEYLLEYLRANFRTIDKDIISFEMRVLTPEYADKYSTSLNAKHTLVHGSNKLVELGAKNTENFLNIVGNLNKSNPTIVL